MLAKHPLDHNNVGLSLKRYVPDKIDQYLSSHTLACWHGTEKTLGSAFSASVRRCCATHVPAAQTAAHLGANSFFEF